ncbi:MAG: hypothetical protein KA408_03220 [Flavobacteriales bacterium]|nr:hypothetical protein [Flavobacteriales bacterium]
MRRAFLSALCFFAIAATIGALLRLIFVVDMPWLLFKPWLHAHSHVAMLGWVFPAVLITIMGQDENAVPHSFLKWILFSQFTVLGMLFAFPLQGYGAASIAFSGLQIVAGYVLIAIVWKHTSYWPKEGSRRLVRLAFLLQICSTIGVWVMGPIMTSKLAGTEWYYWSVQWFLHFQFNGWFWFAAMAIGSRWAELHGVDVRIDKNTIALWVISIFLTFALVIAWSERNAVVLTVNSAGVLIQFWAAWRTLQAMRRARLQAFVKTTPWMRILIGVMLLSMAARIAAQTAVSIPAVANMALTLRNYVIGFIHLNTLGAVSALLFTHALMKGWINERIRIVPVAIVLFIAGFLLSEVMLFVQGTMFWMGCGLVSGYYGVLFGVSVLLPVAVVMLVLHFWRTRNEIVPRVSSRAIK